MADDKINPEEEEAVRPEADATIRALFEKMEEAKLKGKQLGMDFGSAAEEEADAKIAQALLGDEPTRDERYALVYSILRLLRDNLAPGEDYEEGRRKIREEIRLYLNKGRSKATSKDGKVKADMKQSDLPRLHVAKTMLEKWVREGANQWDAYVRFWEMNEQMGYHKNRYGPPLKIKGTFDDLVHAAVRDDKPERK